MRFRFPDAAKQFPLSRSHTRTGAHHSDDARRLQNIIETNNRLGDAMLAAPLPWRARLGFPSYPPHQT